MTDAPQGTVPVRLASLRLRSAVLEVGLAGEDRTWEASVALRGEEVAALQPLTALHGHARGCARRPLLLVDLLVHSIERCRGRIECVIVRPGSDAAFWLRLHDGDSGCELTLPPLDAVALLMSRRIPVVADTAGRSRDWDAALRGLVEGS